jgi:hypothetical protein
MDLHLISRWLCDLLPAAPNFCFVVLSRSRFVHKFDLIVVHDMDYYLDKLDPLLLFFCTLDAKWYHLWQIIFMLFAEF